MTGPSSRPSVGRKMLNPVSLRPRMIDQLMEEAPRCSGSRLGWNWMVPSAGISHNDWHELGHEGHDADLHVGGSHGIQRGGVGEFRELMHGQPALLRGETQ